MTDLTLLLSLVFVEGRFDVESELGLPDGSRVSVYAGGVPGPGRGFSAQVLSGNYQFGLDFENVPFSVSKPWLAWMGIEPPPGSISATVRGAGTWQDPIIDVKSQVRGFVYKDWPPLQIDLDVEHDGKRLDLRDLSLGDEQGPIARLSGEVSATPLELADFQVLRASLGRAPIRREFNFAERRLDQLPKPIALAYPLVAGATVTLAQTPQGPKADLTMHATWPDGEAGIGACTIVRRPDLSLTASAVGNTAKGKLAISSIASRWPQARSTPTRRSRAGSTGSVPFAPPRMDLDLHASTDTAEELPVLCEYVAGPFKLDIEAKDLFADPPDVRFVAESAALQLVPNASQGQRFGNMRDSRAIGRPFSIRARGRSKADASDTRSPSTRAMARAPTFRVPCRRPPSRARSGRHRSY